MCGRFYNIYDIDDITTRFRVDRPRDLSVVTTLAPPRWSVWV